MCGIAGVWQRDQEVDRNTIIRMRESLKHRGPDAEGLYFSNDKRLALGFRRLSIIDLSEAGNQPIVSQDGSLAIVFNGEIVNYASIRQTLEQDGFVFASNGDAEVVLNAFIRWGVDCLHRFQGMFALAIWNSTDRSLFIARDRFGIKPLYYYHDARHFLFGSELRAILEHPAVSREIDPGAFEDYLSYGYVPFDRAIISGVKKLPAGHSLSMVNGAVAVQRYWQLEYRPRQASIAEFTDGLRERISHAVKLWSVSDVPVGVFLSGGIDSSAVCSFLDHSADRRVLTCSIGLDYQRRNELDHARTVAENFGTDHHERIVTVSDAAAMLPMLAEMHDEPFYDTSSIPTSYLSRFTAERVKVALGGDGGDELLFGYTWYTRFLELEHGAARRFLPDFTPLIGAMRRLPMAGRLAGLERYTTADSLKRYFRLVGFMDPVEKERIASIRNVGNRDPLWLFRKFYRSDLPPATALRMLDISTYLVDNILTKVDRASMAASLEVRPPLLEHTLAEYIMTIPDEMIHQGGDASKRMFRRAMQGILPESIVGRSKRGFSAPIRHWLRGDLALVARERLLDGLAVRDGLLNRRGIETMISGMSENRWAKLWMLLMFEGWYRRWIYGIREEVPSMNSLSMNQGLEAEHANA